MTVTRTQFWLMLKVAATELTKFLASCQSLVGLVDESNRTANSMLHCVHAKTYQRNKLQLSENAQTNARHCQCSVNKLQLFNVG